VRLAVFAAQISVDEFLPLAKFKTHRRKTVPPKPPADTHCAMPRLLAEMAPNGCAMISRSLGQRAKFSFVVRTAKRSTPMMAADRSILSFRVFLFLLAAIGIPTVARCSTLEDSARELARKIAEVVPPGEKLSWEIRNLSPLKPGEVSQIGQTLQAELQERGVRLESSGAAVTVVVTLSENFKNLVWTGEIHQSDSSQVVLIAVERVAENRAFSNAMPVTIRSEKFWEGAERILDAGEISNGVNESWLVLLLPNGLRIQDKQTGSASTIGVPSDQNAGRDHWGNLNIAQTGNTVGLFLAPQVCTANLETRVLLGCSATQVATGGMIVDMIPVMFDVAPAGPPPAGKGTVVEMTPVCGGSNEFLATGAGDYTQRDSVQVFETESSGAGALSRELDFPGPITALHAGQSVQGAPRAVVRNLTTGNYEAYRLSFSCVQ
jgi:hypothetical protein